MSQGSKNRVQDFRWNSRYELYHFLKNEYGLVKSDVDLEIHRVMKTFRPRKHQAIHTKELWQKVGMNLEKIHKKYSTTETGEAVFEVNIPMEQGLSPEVSNAGSKDDGANLKGESIPGSVENEKIKSTEKKDQASEGKMQWPDEKSEARPSNPEVISDDDDFIVGENDQKKS